MSDALCYSASAPANHSHNLGGQHYSYRFAEEKFRRCFAAMPVDMHFLAMPEYYSTSRSFDGLPTWRGRHVHMIFRSTEAVRVLKGAVNILCFAWEFPYLKDTSVDGEHPFLNQKRMLSTCDEIWVPCRYSKTVLERHGISNVHCIPAPLGPSTSPRHSKAEAVRMLGHIDTKPFHVNFLGHLIGGQYETSQPLYTALTRSGSRLEDRRIYLSVFNPEDFRKNLDSLVRGFDAFSQRHPEAVLIIKAVTSTDRFSLTEVVQDVMLRKLASGSSFANNNILVCNDYLRDDEMTALYDLADFYLCTSLAEGQNLPLLEAMVRGVVPVTTRNTAMLDYIEPGNAIIVETAPRLNDCAYMAGNIAGRSYHLEFCSARQVTAALEAASALTNSAYAALSNAATRRVAQDYGYAQVGGLIAARLDALSDGDRPPRQLQLVAPTDAA